MLGVERDLLTISESTVVLVGLRMDVIFSGNIFRDETG